MKNLPITAIALLLTFASQAQTPPGLPEESTPIDFSNWADVLFFIVIPVLMVGVFLFLRRRPRSGEE